MTILWLELLAVLIGVHAVNFVAEINYHWMDFMDWFSMCYIGRKPLPIFVENCVREIKSQKNLLFCYIASLWLCIKGYQFQKFSTPQCGGIDLNGF